jgi:hypothetical protein
MAAGVKCTHCEWRFPIEDGAGWTERECPGCSEHLHVFRFPALTRPPRIRPGKNVAVMDGQAACFFHAHKSASHPCDACGRFLCDLCDFESHGKHYCASCLDQARKSGKGAPEESEMLLKERVYLPHNLAVGLAVYSPLSIIGLYFIPFTAPAALWISFRHWKNPGGFQVRGKSRFVAAILLATLQLIFSILLGLLIFIGVRKALAK